MASVRLGHRSAGCLKKGCPDAGKSFSGWPFRARQVNLCDVRVFGSDKQPSGAIGSEGFYVSPLEQRDWAGRPAQFRAVKTPARWAPIQ